MSTATTLQQADFSGFRSLGIGDVEDLSKICCICGKIPNKPVYSLFGSQCQKMQIAEKMHKHLNIEINEDDPPPRGICEYCLNILISWDELVCRCAQIQEILHQWKSNRAVNNETGLGLSYSVQLEQTKPELDVYNNLIPNVDGFIINDLKMKVKVEAEHEIKQDNEKKKSLLEHKENIERPETVVIEDGKKYGVCNICKKKVLTASWKRHLRSHQATKRFRCHSCGLGFSDSGNLARHTRALHADYRPFACHICHKTFSRKGHLQDHVRSHSDDREYICDMCGKASKSSAALRMHRKVHENGYRFQCLYCNSKFKRQGQLNAHISVHTGEKAHICACGKTFRLKSQLTIHARLHDRVKL